MGYSSFYVCLVTNGAKDGILVHSDWYHASKGEQLLPYGIHETCPYPFTHGKYAWASNMDSS